MTCGILGSVFLLIFNGSSNPLFVVTVLLRFFVRSGVLVGWCVLVCVCEIKYIFKLHPARMGCWFPLPLHKSCPQTPPLPGPRRGPSSEWGNSVSSPYLPQKKTKRTNPPSPTSLPGKKAPSIIKTPMEGLPPFLSCCPLFVPRWDSSHLPCLRPQMEGRYSLCRPFVTEV